MPNSDGGESMQATWEVKRKYDLVWGDASGACGPAVQGHDGFYDRKPEPGPAQIAFARTIDPVKAVKNAIHMLRRNHGATIYDVQIHAVTVGSYNQLHVRTGRAMTNCIGQQVGDGAEPGCGLQ